MGFDKEKAYNEEIAAQVKKLCVLCEKEHIPFFMTFAVKDSRDGTKYVNEMLSPGALDIRLVKDHFAHHVNVLNGFLTTPTAKAGTFDDHFDFDE